MKKSLLLSKVVVISSYLWFINTLIFILIIFFSTSFFSIDPCYGQGCSEHIYLLPMLASLFLGIIFFVITILAGFFRVVLNYPKWQAPLRVGSWKMGVITFGMVIISIVYFLGISRSNFVNWGQGYTGYDLLSTVNSHRSSVGLQEMVLSDQLCDNLVSRWQSVKDGKQHEGFEEWVTNEGIQTEYGYKEVAELYVQASSPTEAVSFWAGSPGHKIQLESEKWTDICTYANDNIGVVILGYK